MKKIDQLNNSKVPVIVFDKKLEQFRDKVLFPEKLAKANRSAATMLRQARRRAANPDMQEDSLDGFMNALDLGDPDPSNHRTGFDSVDDIVDWFKRDSSTDWRQHD